MQTGQIAPDAAPVIPPKRPQECFGAVVAGLRHERQLGQAEVARRAGCSAAHVSNIEHGRSAPPGESLAARLSAALGLRGVQARRFASQAREALAIWRRRRRDERTTLRNPRREPALAVSADMKRPYQSLPMLLSLAHGLNSSGASDSGAIKMEPVGWSGYRLDQIAGRLHVGLNLPEVEDAELVIALTDGDVRLSVERRSPAAARSPPM